MQLKQKFFAREKKRDIGGVLFKNGHRADLIRDMNYPLEIIKRLPRKTILQCIRLVEQELIQKSRADQWLPLPLEISEKPIRYARHNRICPINNPLYPPVQEGGLDP